MGHSEVEDAKTGGVEPTVSAVVVPMSRKAREMGHPQLDGALGRQHPNGRPGPPPSALPTTIPRRRVGMGQEKPPFDSAKGAFSLRPREMAKGQNPRPVSPERQGRGRLGNLR